MCDTAKTRVPRSTVVEPWKLGGRQAEGADDSALIRDAQRGDAAAFEELVRRYDGPVLRLALHLTGSEQDAQDIYQEAFLRAYRNLPRFRFDCSFYTWIYHIVTSLCLDHLRKQLRVQNVTAIVPRVGKEEELVNLISDHIPGSGPERSLSGRELGQCILRALQTLSPRERLVFELKHYHSLRLRTVAGILNTTEDTIKNTLLRATQKLRTQLAEVR
jgi:RNA polymerase sigma-70 factor, ECF subfamily